MNPPVCHITHISNLSDILTAGGLWCDAKTQERGVCRQGIAHDHIKARRAKRKVTVGVGGVLCDYVPFYFWYHSPMLYAIHTGFIAGYEGGQSNIIYLVSDVDRVQNALLPFCFTNGHADMAFSQYFTDRADFALLDWETIKAKQWADTVQDNDRTRRKQAEFLVHDFLPWHCIKEIGVFNDDVAEQVRAAVSEQDTPVRVRRNWYY